MQVPIALILPIGIPFALSFLANVVVGESTINLGLWDTAGSSDARIGHRGTVVFLHGATTQSYSYRVVMSQVVILILLSGVDQTKSDMNVKRSNNSVQVTIPRGHLTIVGRLHDAIGVFLEILVNVIRKKSGECEYDKVIVAVKQGNLLATAEQPELTIDS
ncbi:hypothetical protein L6452_37660 [Arctium lappa]|uniref:Uncharacterized protein n=1 Tax=Arctium lappa TaxID=4217 RepID=A0ACB8Y2X5_ARCLA|nr:hypothetical protein L6452_37660 [Arctium lappa]